MRSTFNVLAFVVASLCVAGFLIGGAAVVLGVVVVGVAALTCKVAAASKPRPLRRSRSRGLRGSGRKARSASLEGGWWETGERSAVLIGHQRDPDIVHDERPDGEGVEDLVEAEPAG